MSDDWLSGRDVAAAVENLLTEVVKKLKASAHAEKNTAEEMWFPDGVQLVSATDENPPVISVTKDTDTEVSKSQQFIVWRNGDDSGNDEVKIVFKDKSPLTDGRPISVKKPKAGAIGNTVTLISPGVQPGDEFEYQREIGFGGDWFRVPGDPKIIIK